MGAPYRGYPSRIPESRELDNKNEKASPRSGTPPKTLQTGFFASWFDPKGDRTKFALKWIAICVGITSGAATYFAHPDAVIYQEKLPPFTDFYYYHDMFLNKTDINHPDNVYDVRIRIASQTFSVQMPIQIVWVNITQTHGQSYNDTLVLFFPRALLDTDKPPGAFERTQVALILSPPKGGFHDGASIPGPSIRYSIQGCYNVVLAAPKPGLASRSLYQNDCTELIIDGIDVRKSLELQRGNIDIQNLVINQNNIIIKITMTAFVAAILFFVIATILNWLFLRNNTHTPQPQ